MVEIEREIAYAVYMIKLVSGAALGIMIMILGGYIASLYFIEDRGYGNSPMLIGIGAVLIAAGIFSFIKGFLSMRADKALVEATDGTMTMPEENRAEGGAILKKNNDMLQEWNKTNQTRDKLKVLEIAGAAEETA